MVQKNSRTYLLAPVVFTPNAWLPSLKASTWVVKICSHSLALACLTTLSCRTKLSAPPDMRPGASRLRMLFIMSSCADGDRSENKSTTDPATKTCLTYDFPLLLKVDSSLRQPISEEGFVRLGGSGIKKKNFFIPLPPGETDEWRRPPRSLWSEV